MTKFELIFENIMIIYGKRIEDEHFILERLSVIGQQLFAMLTVISRASRSYCIGLRNSELEITYANMFCTDARYTVLHLLEDLQDRVQLTYLDDAKDKIAEHTFKEKGYVLENPLQKNW